MFLKRLDIIGFKSFADRISVDFVPGVTAVVGPNGSGKSNITDGIRWVLGEQSAKSLRGSKMEDVIFAGSDSRNALNFAEVTLTLENEDGFLPIDYQEVSITRRVYRSGESEFLINKQNCRLKDIVDLFMDSGLGKEAFSIISQGEVEKILNSKAEDRRSIFEEAAGVLKYKTRKKKAENKLVETQDNLNRVNDILHELESQIDPLRIQASMAKEYLEHKKNLEQVEVALMVHEIEEAYKQWEELTQKFEQYKAEELKLASVLQSKESKMEEVKNHLSALDESIDDLQQVLLLSSEELEKLEGRKEVLKERKKNVTQNQEQLEKTEQELAEKMKLLTEQQAEQKEQVNMLQQEKSLLKAKLDEKEKELERYSENLEIKLEALKSDYIELLNEQAAYRNENSYIQQQLETQKIRAEKLETEHVTYIKTRTDIQTKKTAILQQLDEKLVHVTQQTKEYQEQQQLVQKLNVTYQKTEKSLYEAYQFLQQAKSRKEMLEELEEDYSGFFQGVKEVLKARGNKLQGIHGAVAELITVPKKYSVSMEIALSASMQHIVVGTEVDGRNAIAYLKKNGFGRATFLPLSVMQPKNLSQSQLKSIEDHPSFVGVAANLISYEDKYRSIIGNLLGSVVITKDLKGANELAKILAYRVRLVTLDGEVVNPGGSMTGGAVKQKSSSILTRKGELEEWKNKSNEIEKTCHHLEEQLKKGKQSIRLEEEKLEQLLKKLEELRLEEQQLKDHFKEVEFEERTLNERLSLYDRNKVDYDKEKADLQQRQGQLQTILAEQQQKITELDQEIAQLTTYKNNQTTSKETVTQEIGELRVQFASIKEQYTHNHNSLTSITSELAISAEKWQTIKEDLTLLSSEMTNSSSGEEFLEVEAEKKRKEKNACLTLITERREERLQLQLSLEDLERDTKEERRIHRGIVQALKDEEIKLNRIDVELDTKLTNLREEYLLSFEGAKEQYPLSMPVEEARKHVKLTKLSMEDLGTVNLGAVEEYERISERHHFLLEQKTDLEEAKNTLYVVIDEMDDEMKKRFEQTFVSIKSHFESVFQSLFGGGRADLRLTNPDDLLNTGIEIVAQPPGKKLQNLGLLSGGERALTAIALLFSILKVRPVPFCILDEVEAALDEANVYRFSQYLKRYSHETQFIVITHRKGTMEEADVLYGVTMQESGISKLVSVRLSETQNLVETT